MQKEKSQHERLVKEKEKQIKKIKNASIDLSFRAEKGEDKYKSVKSENDQ